MSSLRAIDASAVAAVLPPEILGAAPQLEWLPIDRLVVDSAYQREVRGDGKRNVRRIAASFNWAFFAPVIVAPVEGGKFAIIDGLSPRRAEREFLDAFHRLSFEAR